MKFSHFFFLVVTSALSTYWMNAAILAGDFLVAGLYAFILCRNLQVSYRVTKFIRLLQESSRR